MAIWIKRLSKGISLLLAFSLLAPLIMSSRVEEFFQCEGFFQFGGHICALIPGKIGNIFRLAYAMGTLTKCHYTADIFFGTYFSKRNVIVEPYVGIGAYCIIGKCILKEGTKISSRVSIVSGLNEHGKANDFLNGQEEDLSVQIAIGPHTWLGEGSIIGANVGSKSVVSMGAVVMKEIGDQCMAMGNPARKLPMAMA